MMTQVRASSVLAVAAIIALGSPRAASAAVMSPDTAAYLTALLASYQTSAPPPGVDPALYRKALEALKKEMFGLSKPPVDASNVVDPYAKALGLGGDTSKYLPQIAAVRNAAHRGDDAALRDAIRQASIKAGKKPPEGDALNKIVSAVGDAKSAEPSASERLHIVRPEYTIDVNNLRDAGEMDVEVTQPGPDGAPTVTSFSGEETTVPAQTANTLQTTFVPDAPPQTTTAAASQQQASDLSGSWTDQHGDKWDIALSGGSVTATDHRQGQTQLAYTGTYALERIEATHLLVAPSDMESDLPDDVKAQLVGRGLTYGLHLHVSSQPDQLLGTWSSQHVTYSGLDHSVENIGDPFDEPLVLSRAGEKVAQGGISPRDGP